MLSWFQAVMPKEEKFFHLFEQHATIVVAGAEALRGLLQGGDRVEHFCREIMARENDADEVTRKVLTAVRRTFRPVAARPAPPAEGVEPPGEHTARQ